MGDVEACKDPFSDIPKCALLLHQPITTSGWTLDGVSRAHSILSEQAETDTAARSSVLRDRGLTYSRA
jgi:hypothetical protein